MIRNAFFMLLVLGVIVGSGGCATQSTKEITPAPGMYPPPPMVATSVNGVYPPPAPTSIPQKVDAYPAAEPNSSIGAHAFQFDKPVYAGSMVVTGHGPANIPLLLVDITTMGDILAQTIVQSDGTFEFQVSPLEGQHRLGIMIGDLQIPGVKEEDFYTTEFYGDEARQIPQLGFFFDTVMVVAP